MSDHKPSPALAILAELRGEAPRPPPPPTFVRDAVRAIEPPPREGEARELDASSSSSSAAALWGEAQALWASMAELLVPAVLGAERDAQGAVVLSPEAAWFERDRLRLVELGKRGADLWGDADATGRAYLSAVTALVRMASHLRAVSLAIPSAARDAAVAR